MSAELKQFLQDMCEKQNRTDDDMRQLGKTLRTSGFGIFMCGRIKEDALLALQALGTKTQDPEIKELAGKLWDDISTDRFLSPEPVIPKLRPF